MPRKDAIRGPSSRIRSSGHPPYAHAVRREAGAAVEQDRGHAPQRAPLLHRLQVLEQRAAPAMPSSRGGRRRRARTRPASAPGWRGSRRRRAPTARSPRARSKSTASAAAASVSVPFSISRSMRILNSRSVGSWRTDSAPVRRCEHVERALEPEPRAGLGGDREPQVEVVVAQVVVRDAGVRVDDLGRAPGVLGVDPRGHQHRAVAEHARVEDRRDLADDALVEQPPRARQHLLLGQLRQARHLRVRAARRAGSCPGAG